MASKKRATVDMPPPQGDQPVHAPSPQKARKGTRVAPPGAPRKDTHAQVPPPLTPKLPASEIPVHGFERIIPSILAQMLAQFPDMMSQRFTLTISRPVMMPGQMPTSQEADEPDLQTFNVSFTAQCQPKGCVIGFPADPIEEPDGATFTLDNIHALEQFVAKSAFHPNTYVFVSRHGEEPDEPMAVFEIYHRLVLVPGEGLIGVAFLECKGTAADMDPNEDIIASSDEDWPQGFCFPMVAAPFGRYRGH